MFIQLVILIFHIRKYINLLFMQFIMNKVNFNCLNIIKIKLFKWSYYFFLLNYFESHLHSLISNVLCLFASQDKH